MKRAGGGLTECPLQLSFEERWMSCYFTLSAIMYQERWWSFVGSVDVVRRQVKRRDSVQIRIESNFSIAYLVNS